MKAMPTTQRRGTIEMYSTIDGSRWTAIAVSYGRGGGRKEMTVYGSSGPEALRELAKRIEGAPHRDAVQWAVELEAA